MLVIVYLHVYWKCLSNSVKHAGISTLGALCKKLEMVKGPLLPWTVLAGRLPSSLYGDWWTSELQWPFPSCNLLLVASIINADCSNKKINNYYRPIYRQSIIGQGNPMANWQLTAGCNEFTMHYIRRGEVRTVRCSCTSMNNEWLSMSTFIENYC